MKKQNYTKSSSNSISLSQPEPHRSSISLHLLFHVYIPIFYFRLYITQLEGNYLNYKFFRSLKLLIKFYFQCKSIHAPTKQSFLTASQTWQELHFYFNLLHLIMKPFSRSKYCIKSPQLKKGRGEEKGILLRHLIFFLETFCSHTSASPSASFGRFQLKHALCMGNCKAWWSPELRPRNIPMLIPSSIFTLWPPS